MMIEGQKLLALCSHSTTMRVKALENTNHPEALLLAKESSGRFLCIYPVFASKRFT